MATKLEPPVQDAGLDGTCGAFIKKLAISYGELFFALRQHGHTPAAASCALYLQTPAVHWVLRFCDTESTMKSRSFTSIRFASVLAVSLALLGMTAAMPATAKEESHRATKFPYASLQA